MSILRQSPEFAKTAAAIPVSTLQEIIRPETVDQAIERSRTRGKRRRRLPAELMAVAIVVLGLFAHTTWPWPSREPCITEEGASKG